ncbi:unnamed protein product [Agarophyton chilense]
MPSAPEPKPSVGGKVRFTAANWQRLPKYPLALLESAGGLLRANDGHELLLIAGGYHDISALTTTKRAYVLDVTNGRLNASWQRVADMPQHLTHCAQALVRDRMYVCGGFEGSAPGRSVAACWMFSLALDKWTALPALPVAVGGGGLLYLEKRDALLFASGMARAQGEWHGSDSTASYELSLRDGATAKWRPRAEVPNARNHLGAVSVAGRHFVLGGQHGANEESGNQRDVQQYDVARDAWVKRSALPLPLGHIVASTVPLTNGFVVVAGVTQHRRAVRSVL